MQFSCEDPLSGPQAVGVGIDTGQGLEQPRQPAGEEGCGGRRSHPADSVRSSPRRSVTPFPAGKSARTPSRAAREDLRFGDPVVLSRSSFDLSSLGSPVFRSAWSRGRTLLPKRPCLDLASATGRAVAGAGLHGRAVAQAQPELAWGSLTGRLAPAIELDGRVPSICTRAVSKPQRLSRSRRWLPRLPYRGSDRAYGIA
jgi:hypothetical protein